MIRRKARPIAVCLLVAVLLAMFLSGCGTKTGDQPAPGTVDEVPDKQDEVTLPSEPQEGEQTDQDESSEDTQPDSRETEDDAAQESENAITIPEINIEKKPIPENEALAFVKAMKAGWNPGNTFDAVDVAGLADKLDYEKAWVGVRTTEAVAIAVKNAGFNTIRIPVSWHNHVSGMTTKSTRNGWTGFRKS